MDNQKSQVKTKPFDKYKVNPNVFINVQTPESAYVLGYMWADGHVKSKHPYYTVTISTTPPDSNDVHKIIKKTGNWNVYQYKHKDNPQWKDSVQMITNNYPLVEFLLKNDYGTKSEASADKILSMIPEHLKHYWFRGLFDGDGYLYLNTILHQYQLGIASSFDQDWSFMEMLLKFINVKYSIKKYISKKHHRSSCLRITSKQGCIIFLNYIYKNSKDDKICLKRKYRKY